jgi:hypothetical protein
MISHGRFWENEPFPQSWILASWSNPLLPKDQNPQSELRSEWIPNFQEESCTIGQDQQKGSCLPRLCLCQRARLGEVEATQSKPFIFTRFGKAA